jgi:trehalose 6-phosphate synthase
MRRRGGLWFGWDGRAGQDLLRVQADGVAYASVGLSAREYQDFYLSFCNGALWPLFHGMLDRVHYSPLQYDAYQEVNRRYALTLASLLQPDDLIWVHDYHLLPLAGFLREAGCTQPIGLFLHVPFPPAVAMLPMAVDLMQAMLAYDVVGFQTAADRAAFHTAVRHPHITTGVFPIGVDVDAIQAAANDRVVAPLSGEFMIGVDRLDYTKGLLERIEAFERFLAVNPQSQLTFLQISQASRAEVAGYAQTRRDVERAIERVADSRMQYVAGTLPHNELMGLMRGAKVGIVTPLRDGMNLVAKEYVAAQNPDDPGVLILSRHAGAACELTSALLVNPSDPTDVARAIETAVAMPLTERLERHRSMVSVLHRNSLQTWHVGFVDTLAAVRGGGGPTSGDAVPST